MQTEQQLNQQFAIPEQLRFERHPSGIVFAIIENHYAKAVISTYGGHMVSYQPATQSEDLFFVSEQAIFGEGKAIRGGTPICWPWFGDDQSGLGRPAHGFARNVQWQVLASTSHHDSSTEIQLGLSETDNSLAVWPHPFQLTMKVVVGDRLQLSLTTDNTGEKAITISQALHSYFKVSDVTNIRIQGLDGVNYLDKLADFAEATQQGDITVNQEVDRIYLQSPSELSILDKGLDRQINIIAQGSQSTVVWNPWRDSTRTLSDMADDEYQAFICVETANAADDTVTIAPGDNHTLQAQYTIN